MTNTLVNSSVCQPQTIHTFIPIFLTLIFFIGLIFNCISSWIFWFRVKNWNSAVILQFNLAISDAIIIPAAPLVLIDFWKAQWIFGPLLCQVKFFLLSTHMYGSIYFLTVISIHRYITVAHNIKRTTLTKKSSITKLCLVIWSCLGLQGIPIYLVLETSKVHGVKRCVSIHQTEHAQFYFVWNCLSLVFGLLIPFSITSVCYSLLSQYILKVNPMNMHSEVMMSKSIQTIFVSLIIFTICYIPVHITRTMGVTITFFFPTLCNLLESVEVAYYITWMLSPTNCCIDPILYCFASEKFKYTFTSCCGFWHDKDQGENQDTTQENQVASTTDDHHLGSLPAKR